MTDFRAARLQKDDAEKGFEMIASMRAAIGDEFDVKSM